MARNVPLKRCFWRRHVWTYDSMQYVVVKRCNRCGVIPDPQQAAMWDFEIEQINKYAMRRDLSLRDRLRAVRQSVQEEMKRRNYVDIDFD